MGKVNNLVRLNEVPLTPLLTLRFSHFRAQAGPLMSVSHSANVSFEMGGLGKDVIGATQLCHYNCHLVPRIYPPGRESDYFRDSCPVAPEQGTAAHSLTFELASGRGRLLAGRLCAVLCCGARRCCPGQSSRISTPRS